MKILSALTIAALLAGSHVAASAETSAAREHGMSTFKALAAASILPAVRPAGTSRSPVEEPAISPNGNPTLTDFAAHK